MDKVPFPKVDTVPRSAQAKEALLALWPSCPFMQLHVAEKDLPGLSRKVETFLWA